MALYQWSTTPATNATAGSINWAEGQAPSTVNDSARQLMADVATYMVNPQFYNFGDTPTYVSATQFTVTGNQTANYTVNRRIKATVTAGTIYGSITVSAYTTLTTVTVVWDSGSLDAGLSKVELGILTPTNNGIPQLYALLSGATFTGLLNQSAGADIASAATIDLSTATGNCPRITGTTATSAFTMNAGQQMWLIANAAWPLTYNATTNKINGGVSYTCAAGDLVHVVKDLSGIIQTTVFKADGTAVVTASTSKYIQKVEATPYVLSTSTAASIPFDDTIPQNTEGLSLCTVSITPTSATSRIVVEGFVSLATNSTVEAIATLCDTSIANSLAVGYATTSAADRPVTFPIRAEFAAGSTTARTYDLRVGTNASQLYTNGISTGRKFGGASACTLTVSEITP